MKMKTLFMVCLTALTAAGLSSCSKENNNATTPTNLDGTVWYYADGDLNGTEMVTGYVLGFDQGKAGFVQERFDPQDSENIEEILNCVGTYEYADGQGSIHFYSEDHSVDYGVATFSVDGNTLTLTFNGTTLPFIRTELPDNPFGPDDPDDPDNPNPGGEVPNPNPGSDLDNTVWMYSYTIPANDPEEEEDINITHLLVFTYGHCIYTYNDEDYDTHQFKGSYNYANGSGSATLSSEEDGDINVSFTVSGNNLMLSYGTTIISMTKNGSAK